MDVPEQVATMMAADRASRALGIELLECRPGYARTTMTIRADMTNGYDIAHGAMVFAVADTCFACACNSHGAPTVASSVDIVFVAPARLGDVLVAEATERTVFGRAGLYDITVRRGDEVVAEFRGRSHRLAPRPTAPVAAD